MKSIIIFLIVIFASLNSFGAHWFKSMKNAKKAALASNRLVLLDFTADWCGPCKKMEREVWRDKEVKAVLENFVLLKLNYDDAWQAKQKYNVKGIPDIYILNGNGDVINHHLGFLNKKHTISFLEDYSFDMKYMQTESINYFKHKGYVTALRLGKSYLTYALALRDKVVKEDFLTLAENYLNESNDFVDKDQTNYSTIKEKIELLKLVSKMYKGKYDSVLEVLNSDFEESEIKVFNKPIFYFLYAACSEFKENPDKDEWRHKLTSVSKNADYIYKISLMKKNNMEETSPCDLAKN